MLIVSGCRGQHTVEIHETRATKKPEDIDGFMRLAQKKVRVRVEPKNKPGYLTTTNPQGYMLIHEGDLSALIKNHKRLKILLGEPAIMKIIKDKKLLDALPVEAAPAEPVPEPAPNAPADPPES